MSHNTNANKKTILIKDNLLSAKIIACFFLIVLYPFFIIIYLYYKFFENGEVLFKQHRLGRNKKVFSIYKIRTMIHGADTIKRKYLDLNEADGPVFKIKNDPRYTKIGKFLSHFGLDELPQLLNVIKGEMTFVGPRPLPVEEGMKIQGKYAIRFTVLPGITSLWVIKGGHFLSFNKWMELDMYYVFHKSLKLDLLIVWETICLFLKLLVQSIWKK